MRHLQLQMLGTLGPEQATLQPKDSRSQGCSWNQSQLHEVSGPLRKHLLPLLNHRHVLALGSTCTHWHHVIALTPIQQLSARCLEAFLPPKITSSRPLCEVLQQQGKVIAKLKGIVPFIPSLLQLDFPDEPKNGARINTHYQQVAWSPQTDLDRPSQWVAIVQLQVRKQPAYDDRTRLVVLDLASCQHAVGQAQPCPTPSQHPLAVQSHLGLQQSARKFQSMSATWTIDPMHIATVSLPEECSYAVVAGRCRRLPASRSQTLIVTDVGSGTEVSGCQELALSKHGLGAISQKGHAMLWAEAWDDDLECGQAVAGYSLPDLKKLYTANAPADLIPADEPFQRVVEDIIWAPDFTLFAVHWTLKASPFQEGGRGSIVQLMDNRHGISIHCADTGEYQGGSELISFQVFSSIPEPNSLWDPSSSYLIHTDQHGTLEFVNPKGIVWASFRQGRGFQPDAACPVTVTWRGAPSGRFLCVIDDYKDASDSHICAAKGSEERHRARFCILETTRGHILCQVFPGGPVGDAIWSDLDDVCLLQHRGALIIAEAFQPSLATPAGAGSEVDWRLDHLPDTHQLLGRIGLSPLGDRVDVLQHVLSPCGRVVVGLRHVEAPQATPTLHHWHRNGTLIGSEYVRRAGTCNDNLVINPDMRTLVWHPQKNACVYAVCDVQGGLHIIDAKANCQVWSWAHAELGAAQSLKSLQKPELQSPANAWPVLAWSHDGHQLVALANGICIVLGI